MSELLTPTVVLALLTMAVGAGLAIILAVRGAGEPTAADPPVEPRDHYVMVELLHQCRRCKAGVPLNGPLERAHCGDCSSDLDLDANRVWAVFAGLGESRAGQGHTQFNLVTEMTWKVEEPRCHACEATLPVAEISVGTDAMIGCPACGASTNTFPAPDWLRRVAPCIQQIYAAEREHPRGEAPALQPADEPAPIAMACPQCSASLSVTASMQRTIQCQYCQTEVFLPDALWRRLHPVEVASRWFVRVIVPAHPAS